MLNLGRGIWKGQCSFCSASLVLGRVSDACLCVALTFIVPILAVCCPCYLFAGLKRWAIYGQASCVAPEIQRSLHSHSSTVPRCSQSEQASCPRKLGHRVQHANDNEENGDKLEEDDEGKHRLRYVSDTTENALNEHAISSHLASIREVLEQVGPDILTATTLYILNQRFWICESAGSHDETMMC